MGYSEQEVEKALAYIEAQHQNFGLTEQPWKSATCLQCGFYSPVDEDSGNCRFFAWGSSHENCACACAYDPACPRFEPHGRPVEINNHDDD